MFEKELYDRKFLLKYVGKELRKRMNITQSDLAKKLGYSQSHVNSILNGDASVKMDKLREFAIALGVSPKEFEDIYKNARVEELKYSVGPDIMPDLGDFSVMNEGDLEEVLLSKNGVKLSDDAKKDLKGYVEFLKSKYPKE